MATLNMRKGETRQFRAIVLPTTHSDTSVTWGSQNPAVASVSPTGLVTALAGGTVNIYAQSNDICSSSMRGYYQIIISIPVTGVTMDCVPNEVEVGKTITLTAVIQPADATNQAVIWGSNNTAVATVHSGIVTGVTSGTVIIGVQTVDGGFTAHCTITVKEAAPPLPRFFLGGGVGSRFKAPNHTCIWVGDEYTVTYNIATEPTAPTEPIKLATWDVKVTNGEGTVVQTLNAWKVSDTSFAIKVKGLAVGSYRITASATITPTHVTRNSTASTAYTLYVYSIGTPDPATWDPTCTHDRHRAPYNPNCNTVCHLPKPPF